MGLFFTGKSTDKSILAFIQGPFLYTRYPVMNYYGRVLMNFLLSTYLNQRDKVFTINWSETSLDLTEG